MIRRFGAVRGKIGVVPVAPTQLLFACFVSDALYARVRGPVRVQKPCDMGPAALVPAFLILLGGRNLLTVAR